MLFASPIWLLGLLPWAGVVVYLLPGRGKPVVVPFVGLWRGTKVKSRWRARRWPGLGIFFALLALLLAILGAAQPRWISGAAVSGEVSIVLDRGATMALPSVSGKPFRNVISRMPSLASDARVTLVPVPGRPIETSGDAWVKLAEAVPPTAIDVQLDQMVADQLRRTRGPVFVLSDRQLKLTDPRIVHIEPEPVEGIAAITAIGARLLPHPQAMVRLENNSNLSSVEIAVQSGDSVARRAVTLPAKGQSANQFFDLPRLGAMVEARIDSDGRSNPWSHAYLVRQSNGIHIVVTPGVDESIRRVAAIYEKNRPALADATEVLISNSPLGDGQSGIWVNASEGGSAGTLKVLPAATTKNVNQWPPAGAASLPASFTPVVSAGDRAIIAVRGDSTRQVWVNADLKEWEKTPDFVVFFANALDWIAGKDRSYAAQSPADLGAGYDVVEGGNGGSTPGEWPGIYRSSQGRLIAVNASEFPKLAAASSKGTSMQTTETAGQKMSITGPVLVAALVCLLVSAIFYLPRTAQ